MLLFVILLASVISFQVRGVIAILSCVIFIVASNQEYFLSRLILTPQSENLSVLVWLQGWHEALINFDESGWNGIGFQQFGLNGPKSEVSHKISYKLSHEFGQSVQFMNVLDGGHLGAKLLGEFGAFGVWVVLASLFLILISIRELGSLLFKHQFTSSAVFAHCCVASFCISIFVRGTGYFSSDVLLFFHGFYGFFLYKNMLDLINYVCFVI